jgi:hypothetical protein
MAHGRAQFLGPPKRECRYSSDILALPTKSPTRVVGYFVVDASSLIGSIGAKSRGTHP